MKSRRNSSRGRQQESSDSTPKRNQRTTKKSSSSFDKKEHKFQNQKKFNRFAKKTTKSKTENSTKNVESSGIRLNKYIANAGICSRREADVFIKAGSATVNGKVVSEMGYKVQDGDVVRFDGSLITPEAKQYILLNKPKNYITTMDDERGRKTVMELVGNATQERIYPVGRLDRNTTGLLLFTNDGDLAKKLTHPKHQVRKIYHASLDKKLAMADLQKISENFKLDGKMVYVDDISYIQGEPKTQVGIQIHSGRNRIVRRIFEHFGYKVTKLDRVVFAGLTKKNLPRGRYRTLTEQEIINLKMI